MDEGKQESISSYSPNRPYLLTPLLLSPLQLCSYLFYICYQIVDFKRMVGKAFAVWDSCYLFYNFMSKSYFHSKSVMIMEADLHSD